MRMFFKAAGVLVLCACLVILVSHQNIVSASELEGIEKEIQNGQERIEKLGQEYKELVECLKSRASEDAPLSELEEGELERDRLREEIESSIQHIDELEEAYEETTQEDEQFEYKDETYLMPHELEAVLGNLELAVKEIRGQLELRIDQGALEDEIEGLEKDIRRLKEEIEEVKRELAEMG